MLQKYRPETELSPQFSEQFCKFGTIVRALAPIKPAAWLAEKLNCSERGAQYLIDGKRRVTARCILVIVAELVA